jgi:hypothetical protein
MLGRGMEALAPYPVRAHNRIGQINPSLYPHIHKQFIDDRFLEIKKKIVENSGLERKKILLYTNMYPHSVII